jgi:hypothetical protein
VRNDGVRRKLEALEAAAGVLHDEGIPEAPDARLVVEVLHELGYREARETTRTEEFDRESVLVVGVGRGADAETIAHAIDAVCCRTEREEALDTRADRIVAGPVAVFSSMSDGRLFWHIGGETLEVDETPDAGGADAH